MTNRARAKGTLGESAVVSWFHAQGERQVERHALHGSRDLGDVNGLPGTVVSVKFPGAGQPTNLSGWLNDLATMCANVNERTPDLELPTGLLIVRRVGYPSPGDWYAVQTLSEWWATFRELLT